MASPFSYDVEKSYDWNYEHGPRLEGVSIEPGETPLRELLGHRVHSRFGIAAGLLLNSRWILEYARLGFDVLTYKTVRLAARECYPVPNWVFLEDGEPLVDPGASHRELVVRTRPPGDLRQTTSSVSFGMPSKSPEVWMEDVARARAGLGEGQLLIVSVVASPSPDTTADDLVRDYGRLAAMAREAGAPVIEANLSCPNVLTAEGSVYLDPALAGRVAAALRREAPDRPILLKVGAFPDSGVLRDLLEAVAGKVNGLVLVNGVSRRIVTPSGEPAFGEGREVAGVLGRGIHRLCVDTVRQTRELVERGRLDLELLAVGGVFEPADARDFLEAGAAAVLAGGSPMFIPDLARRIREELPEL